MHRWTSLTGVNPQINSVCVVPVAVVYRLPAAVINMIYLRNATGREISVTALFYNSFSTARGRAGEDDDTHTRENQTEEYVLIKLNGHAYEENPEKTTSNTFTRSTEETDTHPLMKLSGRLLILPINTYVGHNRCFSQSDSLWLPGEGCQSCVFSLIVFHE